MVANQGKLNCICAITTRKVNRHLSARDVSKIGVVSSEKLTFEVSLE